MTATRGIALDDETARRLKALAEARDRSPHWVMNTALLEYLEREERYEREKANGQARWERSQLTGEAVTHEQVAAWLERSVGGAPQPGPC